MCDIMDFITLYKILLNWVFMCGVYVCGKNNKFLRGYGKQKSHRLYNDETNRRIIYIIKIYVALGVYIRGFRKKVGLCF